MKSKINLRLLCLNIIKIQAFSFDRYVFGTIVHMYWNDFYKKIKILIFKKIPKFHGKYGSTSNADSRSSPPLRDLKLTLYYTHFISRICTKKILLYNPLFFSPQPFCHRSHFPISFNFAQYVSRFFCFDLHHRRISAAETEATILFYVIFFVENVRNDKTDKQ